MAPVGRLISLFFMSGDRFVLEVMISNFTGNATGGLIFGMFILFFDSMFFGVKFKKKGKSNLHKEDTKEIDLIKDSNLLTLHRMQFILLLFVF